MKTLACWLYPFAAVLAALGGLNESSFFMFCLFCVCITVFLGIAQLFVWLFAWLIVTKKDYREHREHGKWIL